MPERVRLPLIYQVCRREGLDLGYREFREAALEGAVPGAYQHNSLWYGDPSRTAEIIAALKKVSPTIAVDQSQERKRRA